MVVIRLRKISRSHLFIFIALAMFASSVWASDRDPEKELREANSRYDLALAEANAPALDSLYRPDFTYIGPGGVMRNKADQIKTIASGTVDIVEGKSHDVVVRIYGDTAILTGRFIGRARVSGDEFSFHERYSTVWIHHEGAWQLALEHGSVTKDD